MSGQDLLLSGCLGLPAMATDMPPQPLHLEHGTHCSRGSIIFRRSLASIPTGQEWGAGRALALGRVGKGECGFFASTVVGRLCWPGLGLESGFWIGRFQCLLLMKLFVWIQSSRWLHLPMFWSEYLKREHLICAHNTPHASPGPQRAHLSKRSGVARKECFAHDSDFLVGSVRGREIPPQVAEKQHRNFEPPGRHTGEK